MIEAFLGGLCVAIGGAIKDSPYEGFKPWTFIRSPIIAGLIGLGLPLEGVLLFLAAIGCERIIVESYKLLRAKKPVKFLNGEWGRAVDI